MQQRLSKGVALAAGVILLVWLLVPAAAHAGDGWVSVKVPRSIHGPRGPETRTKTVKLSHGGKTGNCRVAVNPDATIVSVEVSENLVTEDQEAIGIDSDLYNKCIKEEKCEEKIKSEDLTDQASGVYCVASCTAKAFHF